MNNFVWSRIPQSPGQSQRLRQRKKKKQLAAVATTSTLILLHELIQKITSILLYQLIQKILLKCQSIVRYIVPEELDRKCWGKSRITCRSLEPTIGKPYSAWEFYYRLLLQCNRNITFLCYFVLFLCSQTNDTWFNFKSLKCENNLPKVVH